MGILAAGILLSFRIEGIISPKNNTFRDCRENLAMYLDMAEAVAMTVDTLGSPHLPSEDKVFAVAVAAAEGTASEEMGLSKILQNHAFI